MRRTVASWDEESKSVENKTKIHLDHAHWLPPPPLIPIRLLYGHIIAAHEQNVLGLQIGVRQAIVVQELHSMDQLQILELF